MSNLCSTGTGEETEVEGDERTAEWSDVGTPEQKKGD